MGEGGGLGGRKGSRWMSVERFDFALIARGFWSPAPFSRNGIAATQGEFRDPTFETRGRLCRKDLCFVLAGFLRFHSDNPLIILYGWKEPLACSSIEFVILSRIYIQ